MCRLENLVHSRMRVLCRSSRMLYIRFLRLLYYYVLSFPTLVTKLSGTLHALPQCGLPSYLTLFILSDNIYTKPSGSVKDHFIRNLIHVLEF